MHKYLKLSLLGKPHHNLQGSDWCAKKRTTHFFRRLSLKIVFLEIITNLIPSSYISVFNAIKGEQTPWVESYCLFNVTHALI